MPSTKTVRHFLHYLTGGGMTFILEYSTFLTLYYHFHLPLLVANSIAFAVGFTSSFLLNRYWVFRRGDHSNTKQITRFATLACFNLVITNLILLTLKHYGVAPAVGKLIVQCMFGVWNYTILRNFVFVHKNAEILT